MTPLVSVIITVYNLEEYIEKCVQSVVNQTYRNLEIIIVNDGSTDRSGEICRQMQEQDSRIIYYEQNNAGAAVAKGAAVSGAHGDYIMILDGDDYLHPQTIEIMVDKAQEWNTDITGVRYKETVSRDDPDQEKYISNASGYVLTGKEAIGKLFSLDNILYVIVCAKLYRSNLLKEVSFGTLRKHEDELLCHRLYAKADKVGLIDEELYYYFQREDSIMHSKFSKDSFYKVKALEDRAQFLIDMGLYTNKAARGYLNAFVDYLHKYKKHYGKDEEYYQKIKEYRAARIGYFRYLKPYEVWFLHMHVRVPVFYDFLQETRRWGKRKREKHKLNFTDFT